jgi:hypothetical protein
VPAREVAFAQPTRAGRAFAAAYVAAAAAEAAGAGAPARVLVY